MRSARLFLCFCYLQSPVCKSAVDQQRIGAVQNSDRRWRQRDACWGTPRPTECRPPAPREPCADLRRRNVKTKVRRRYVCLVWLLFLRFCFFFLSFGCCHLSPHHTMYIFFLIQCEDENNEVIGLFGLLFFNFMLALSLSSLALYHSLYY